MNRTLDKIVIITGGAGAIGLAQARHLLAEGASVVLTDLDADTGTAAATELGERCTFVRHDVASEDDWQGAIDATVARFGRVDGLVHNAAVYLKAPILECTAEQYTRVVTVNQIGTFLGLKVTAAAMRGHGGSIVILSSVNGLQGTAGSIAYGSTKWAVRGMAKTAALEFADVGIRVNSVHPGPIDTPMIAGHRARPGGMDAVVAAVPMGRLGTTDDVAPLVTFLISDESSYCTGAEFVVDGGSTAGKPPR